ncbi:MAG: transglutaminase family protein [Bacteroidota bacterium]|nr:transglutaminase family protein [Bacteroidota bacterium]
MAKNEKKEISNLMELLDEQDESLFARIFEKILSYGLAAIPYLEIAREKSLDDLVHSRIRNLVSRIKVQNLFSELHNWAIMDSDDLLKGYYIVSKYQFPDLEEERVMAKVESLKKEVWLELKKGMTPFEELKVMSKVFFEIKKMWINPNLDAMPDSLCLNAVLNSGKGYTQALSVLYTGIAQRLGIPIYGVRRPESFLLAYVYSANPHERDMYKDVQFYLNPFYVGFFSSIDEVERDLKNDFPGEFEKYKGACTNTELIAQLLNSMVCPFYNQSREDKVDDIDMLIKALNVD